MAQGSSTNKLLRIPAALREHGLHRLMREALHRATEACCEKWLRVQTAGKIHVAELGHSNGEWHEYAPMGYLAIVSALCKIPIPLRSISFLDIGSGKARPVIVASAMGCCVSRGVDISHQLNVIARTNLTRMRGPRGVVEIIDANAESFEIPIDVNVIYVANSFSGDTLEAMIRNIRDSYCRWKRPLYIIYFNTRIFDQHIAAHPWISRLYSRTYYPGFTCGIYQVGHTK